LRTEWIKDLVDQLNGWPVGQIRRQPLEGEPDTGVLAVVFIFRWRVAASGGGWREKYSGKGEPITNDRSKLPGSRSPFE
jgi:hypothetical protein